MGMQSFFCAGLIVQCFLFDRHRECDFGGGLTEVGRSVLVK